MELVALDNGKEKLLLMYVVGWMVGRRVERKTAFDGEGSNGNGGLRKENSI